METRQLGSHEEVLLTGHYDTIRESVEKDVVNDINLIGITTKYCYVNLTGSTLVMKDRYGTVYTLPPTNQYTTYRGSRHLILYKEYQIADDVDIITEEMDNVKPLDQRLTQTDHLRPGFEHAVSKRESAKGERNHRPTTKRVGVRSTLTLDSLKTGVYLPEFDVIIFPMGSSKTYHHPCSPNGRIILDRNKFRKDASLNVVFRIYDANNVIGDRWVNLNGFVTRLNVDRSGKHACGVSVMIESDLGVTQTGLITFEEADERFKLFKTKEEAECLGNTLDKAKREWEAEKLELEQEVERLKLMNSKATAKNKHTEHIYDEEKLNREKEAADDRFEKEREKRDEEHKAAMRKFTLDILKFVPLVILATIGVINSFKKK